MSDRWKLNFLWPGMAVRNNVFGRRDGVHKVSRLVLPLLSFSVLYLVLVHIPAPSKGCQMVPLQGVNSPSLRV